MYRGSAVIESNMAYFNGQDSNKVYSYDSATHKWHQLPDTPLIKFTLAIVQHMLTTVGGIVHFSGADPNSLLSLMGEGGNQKWLPHFPAMPTRRKLAAVVSCGHSLIVAGGWADGHVLTTVEVLDTDTQQWSTACSLPQPFYEATMSICGPTLYMLGGWDRPGLMWTSSVLACSVHELLQSCQPQSLAEKLPTASAKRSTIWRRIADAPHYTSSCATLCGQLVAVGGSTWEGEENSTAIFAYNEATNSWEAMGDMPTARCSALVATLDGKMMVVGGNVACEGYVSGTDVVEILQ